MSEPMDISDDLHQKMRDAAQAAVRTYQTQVRENPALMSILYDIDLLPEQIMRPVNASRMIAFCEVFKQLTPEQTSSLFAKADP